MVSADASNGNQLVRCRDGYSRLIGLLDITRDRILRYSPSGTHLSPTKQQIELDVFSELNQLVTLANDLATLFRQAQRKTPSSTLLNHPTNLAISAARGEEYQVWADELDGRGVEFWNRASQLKRLLDTQRSSKPDYLEVRELYTLSLRSLHQRNHGMSKIFKAVRVPEPSLPEKICATMRQLGYIMILLGSPPERDLTLLLKLINIASKSTKAQLAVQDLKSAMKNLELACELDQQLQEMGLSREELASKEKDFTITMLVYFSTKADCSWASGNETGTVFNLRQALDHFPKASNTIQPLESLQIISSLYTFAREWLKPSIDTSERSEQDSQRLPFLIKASEWLTLALHELDSHAWNSTEKGSRAHDHAQQGSCSELKVKIIKALAYSLLEAASFKVNDQEELQRKGEQALMEAISIRPNQALWLRKIQLLLNRHVFGPELRSAVKEVLKTPPFNRELINRLMSVAHSLPEDSERCVICGEIFLACVIKMEPNERNLGDVAFYTIVLTSLVSKNSSKNRPHKKAGNFTLPQKNPSERSKFQFLKETADNAVLENSEFRLGSDSAFMSQTMIWHRGDQDYKEMRYDSAAHWYTFGMHAIFSETREVTFTKLARKAALSWVNQGNYELARKCLKNLPPQGYNEAGTHFLSFMIDSAHGNEESAIQAIDRLMNSIDFKPETLLYAAQQANQRGLQSLLHHILQKTLEATSGASGTHFIQGLDMVVLLRSLIRIDLLDLKSSHKKRIEYAQRILQHYRAAREMMAQSQEAGGTHFSAKDANWLWKTAFNTCTSATEEWPEKFVFEFFSLTADLIAETRKMPTSLEEVQMLTKHELHCRFACLAGNMNQALSTEIGDYNRDNLEQQLLVLIRQLKKLSQEAQDIISDNRFLEKLSKIRSCLCVWEFEAYSMGNDWEAIRYFIKELELSQQSQTFVTSEVTESIAEIACKNPTLSTELLIFVLQHVLKIVDIQRECQISLRSRWIRLMIDLQLSMQSDEKALEYSNKALELKQKYPDEYPSDEANWILAKSWDRSIDLYASQNIIQSKRWCEIALKWMEFVIGGRAYEDMMNRHYRDLLKLTATLETDNQIL